MNRENDPSHKQTTVAIVMTFLLFGVCMGGPTIGLSYLVYWLYNTGKIGIIGMSLGIIGTAWLVCESVDFYVSSFDKLYNFITDHIK